MRRVDTATTPEASGPIDRLAAACLRIAESPRFQTAIIAAILLNAFVLGLETYDAIADDYGTLLHTLTLYLLAHVAARLRNIHTLNKQRLLCAVLLVALIPAGTHLPALATLAILAGVLVTLIGYETWLFAERRAELRHPPTG